MSAREKFKNANIIGLNNESGRKTLTDEVREGLESIPETKVVKNESPVPEKKNDNSGRRRKFSDDAITKFVNVQMLEEEVKFLEKYGGEFGGKTGYVRKLVQEEMSRVLGR